MIRAVLFTSSFVTSTLLLFLTGIVLTTKPVFSQSTEENEFIFPPAYDPTNDFYKDNPVYTAGERITIKWRTNYDAFKLYSMQGSEVVSYSEDLKLESNATSSPHATSYSWEVWTNIEDPPYLPLYLVIFNSADESKSFRSRSFNITNGKAPDGIAYTATERDPSVRTFTTTTTRISPVETTTIPGESTSLPTTTPTLASEVEAEDGNNSNNDDDKDHALKLGLGIGLGVGLGIPFLAVVVLFSCGVMICRAVALDYNPRDEGEDGASVVEEGRRGSRSTTGSNIVGGVQDGEKV
ncbi:hypothetical protein TWF506_001305 [Arthrobotrys conoides]|uniref:Mid2 domain-containing protein n=1 Tax=Arthrobotrys conoides TaxID=74498 RepID=A0AAN8RR87_9PEZI